ncbi:MAG: cation transporter, partial [Salinivirgaceae bacterium]|nr:cation transporter [Salinivirgaceae bacterium]
MHHHEHHEHNELHHEHHHAEEHHHHHHDEDGEHEHHHHHHEHGHHHHHHSHELTSLSKAFVVGIMLNVLFVVAEAIAGWVSNSMGLLADAGHNLSDVASLLLALIAFRMAKRKASHHYTYGYKKSTVLVSLLNAIILMVAVVFIVYESVEQLLNPEPVGGKVIVITAAIGVVINGLTAYLFIDKKDSDLNVKGAYLHMAADALVSVGVVVSGVVIYFTGWYFIDAIIGLTVAVIIIISTWDLLKDSLRLAMDGVPASIDTLRLTNDICKI